MNEDQARQIARRLDEYFTIGTFSSCLDEFDFDFNPATEDEVVDVILNREGETS